MRVAAKCPSCGAGLEIEDTADDAKCSYCGTTSYLQRAGAPPPPPGTAVIDLAALHATLAHEVLRVADEQQRREEKQNLQIGFTIAAVIGVVSVVALGIVAAAIVIAVVLSL